MNKNIVISIRTIILTLGIIVLGALLFEIREVIIQLFIALILALSIEPAVKSMVKHKTPRWLGVTLVFSFLVLLIIGFFTIALPLVISQTQKLIVNLPSLIESVIKDPLIKESINQSVSQLALSSAGLFSVTYSVVTNAFNFLTVLIFTLYLSLDLPNVKRRFLDLFADDLKKEIEDAWRTIEQNLGNWIKGQLLLMFVVGFISYVGLVILKVPYAPSIALIAGFLEVVPVLGPIVATIVAAIVGFAVSPVKGIAVIILFTAIQQLENSVLVPRIMQKIIGFNPLVTMIALLIGGKLLGVVGALIALPVALILVIIFHKLVSLDFE